MNQPPPEALASWITVFSYLCVAITACVVLYKHLAGKPGRTELGGQPIEVREASSFATKPELNALEGRVGGEIHQLHGRISGVRNEANEKIDAMEARIDAIPQRTIELLKTVKEYHKS